MDDREKLVLALRGLQARSKLHVFLFAPGLIVLGAVLLVSAYEFNHLHDVLTMKEEQIASLNAEAKASKALGASIANARADREACLAELNTELNRSKEDLIKERDAANEERDTAKTERDTAKTERDTAKANAQAAERERDLAESDAHKAKQAEEETVAAREATAQAVRELQKALDKERKRVIELENEIGSRSIDLAK